MSPSHRQTYDKGIETFFHAHIISFFEVAEVDVFDFVFEIVIGELIKSRSHDCGIGNDRGHLDVKECTNSRCCRPPQEISHSSKIAPQVVQSAKPAISRSRGCVGDESASPMVGAGGW